MSSGIDFNTLKNQYQELADELITDVNATPLKLYFRTGTTSNASVTDNLSDDLSFDMLGGRTPVKDMHFKSIYFSISGIFY